MNTQIKPLPVAVENLRLEDLPANGRLSSTMFRAENGQVFTQPENITANGTTIGEEVINWFRGKAFKRHPATAEQALEMRRTPPLYVRPMKSNAQYLFVDIEACYPTLYTRLRWDDEILSGIIKRGRPDWSMSDFPLLHNKRARSAVVGMCYGGTSYEVRNHQIVSSRTWRGYHNPHLIHIIMTAAHDMAHNAVERGGAIYWNTDGGIIPRIAYERLASYAADVYGFNLRIQGEGDCEIVAAGCYRVGDKISQPMTSGLAIRPRSFTRVDKVSRYEAEAIMYLLRS